MRTADLGVDVEGDSVRRAAIYDDLRLWDLAELSPTKMAAVLVDLAGQLRELKPGFLARHEVHPAAVVLRDVAVEMLHGLEAMSEYDTARVDAQGLGLHLGWVVSALQYKRGLGHEVDLLALGAYEDELAGQEGATS